MAAESAHEWQRRRRLAQVFGDDLPAVTADEVSSDGGGADHTTASDAADQWLQENRPPHHE